MMFDAELFADRRKRLMAQMKPDSIALIPTAPIAVYSRDTDYRFRPDSDFYFLTGFREPEAVAIISTRHPDKPFTLFVRPRDPEKETWTGRRYGVDGAKEKYKADEAFVISEFDEKLPEYLEDLQAVYHFLGKNQTYDRKLLKAWQTVRTTKLREGILPPNELIDLGHILHEMRLVKTPADMEIMRTACRISSEAHELAMRAVKPGMYERELEALIDHYFRASGGFGAGFPTIVASGENGCILHYIENEMQIKPDDLVLIDAGCEYEMFNGDITRTFPASGKFTAPQRAVYDVVLAAQMSSIEKCTTESTMNDVHEHALKILVDGMIDLKLLEGSADEIIENETYKKFYMHKTGHFLGVDVHDVGNPKKKTEWRKFEPGMVTTVEPGLYISPDSENIPEELRGIGVRIEDNIRITANGPENLTEQCPKKPEDVEAIIG
jgi:Xaa-Pro aminopeptidase